LHTSQPQIDHEEYSRSPHNSISAAERGAAQQQLTLCRSEVLSKNEHVVRLISDSSGKTRRNTHRPESGQAAAEIKAEEIHFLFFFILPSFILVSATLLILFDLY
jgi:hypothetical protein